MIAVMYFSAQRYYFFVKYASIFIFFRRKFILFSLNLTQKIGFRLLVMLAKIVYTCYH